MTPRFCSVLRPLILLGSALSLTACGAVNELVQIDVNPSGAAIYLNGESQGEGSKPVRFDFSKNRRVILQVVYEGHRPFYTPFTADQIARIVDDGRAITATLRTY